MSEITLKNLSSKHLDGVVDVISEAFYGEAITGRVYDFSKESVRQDYRLNSEIMVLTALKGNYPALVALEGNLVVGAAMLKPVQPAPFSATWRIYLPRIPKLLRLFIKARCWQGMEFKRKMGPPHADLPPAYITLEAIGVTPGFFSPQLINQLKEFRSAKTLRSLENKFKKYDLVILDELGYISFDKEGSELLFTHLSLRAGRKSTIVTSNLSFNRWEEVFKDPVMTAAMIDRLTHKSYVVNMHGDSYRFKDTKAWMNEQ